MKSRKLNPLLILPQVPVGQLVIHHAVLMICVRESLLCASVISTVPSLKTAVMISMTSALLMVSYSYIHLVEEVRYYVARNSFFSDCLSISFSPPFLSLSPSSSLAPHRRQEHNHYPPSYANTHTITASSPQQTFTH